MNLAGETWKKKAKHNTLLSDRDDPSQAINEFYSLFS